MKKVLSKLIIFLPLVIAIAGSIIYNQAAILTSRTYDLSPKIIAYVIVLSLLQSAIIFIVINITKDKASKIVIALLSIALVLSIIIITPYFIWSLFSLDMFVWLYNIDFSMMIITITAYLFLLILSIYKYKKIKMTKKY